MPKTETERADKPEKNLLYLGADATSTAAGRPWKAAEAIRGIWHPRHSLHDQYDPDRYDITKNKRFAALVEVVRAEGVPGLVGVRVNGMLKEGDPELVFLQQNYATLRKQEPVVETVWGNSRLAAALLVNTELRREGTKPIRVPCQHKPGTDAQTSRRFSQENNVRQANSLYQNVLIVERTLGGGGSYEDLVLELGLPADELRRVYEPLRGLPAEIVRAYEKGKITLGEVKKLRRYASAAQLVQLDDCLARRNDWAPKPRTPRAERPQRLDIYPDERDRLAEHLKMWREKADDPILERVLRRLLGEDKQQEEKAT